MKLPIRNIEIEIARGEIEKLRRYLDAIDDETQAVIARTFHTFIKSLIKNGWTPAELITRIERAIELDKFRPRNLSLFQLATSKDLYRINGDFDTFRPELNSLFRDPAKHGELRDCFDWVTANRFDLSEQFAYDWTRRMAAHPKLVRAAKSATGDDAILGAYNKLFAALCADFCNEYNINRELINAQLIRDWDSIHPWIHDTQSGGFQIPVYILKRPAGMPTKVWRKTYNEFTKSPKTYPTASPASLIYVVLAYAHKYKLPMFIQIMSLFVHEMHHALDRLSPRNGALGPQVQKIDDELYVKLTINRDDNFKAASERSSYAIQAEFIKSLQSTR